MSRAASQNEVILDKKVGRSQKVDCTLPSTTHYAHYDHCGPCKSNFITYLCSELLEDNLRYPRSVIENAIQFALDRGWIEIHNDHYSLSLTWFRSVTRVLSRQNLLAGVREEIS